ncbi:MAG: 4-hydroxy-tetrahydrodipicolinate reductase [Wolinella sp.]
MRGVGIFGATGRVGKLLVELLRDDDELKIASVFVRKELDFSMPPGALITNEYKTFLEACDVVIDFSLPDATASLLETALQGHKKPLIIGTTGLSSHHFNLIKEASAQMPVLYATNMSLGVAILNKIVQDTAKTLRDFDIEIVEMHHKHKKDSPSGTALTLAESCAKARGIALDDVRVSGRNGNIGERKSDEIAVMSLRGGDVAGRHTVGFYNEGEFLEFTHAATSRMTFAKGAVRAAKWLVQQKNGLYGIADSLGI